MTTQEYTIVDHMVKYGSENPRKLDLKLIKDFISANPDLIKTRRRECVMARRYLAYLIAIKLGHTFELAGKVLGGLDHSTISVTVKRHYEAVETKDKLYLQIKKSTHDELEKFQSYGY